MEKPLSQMDAVMSSRWPGSTTTTTTTTTPTTTTTTTTPTCSRMLSVATPTASGPTRPAVPQMYQIIASLLLCRNQRLFISLDHMFPPGSGWSLGTLDGLPGPGGAQDVPGDLVQLRSVQVAGGGRTPIVM
ncbi:unnamed protein product [Arctogadus glacialis]